MKVDLSQNYLGKDWAFCWVPSYVQKGRVVCGYSHGSFVGKLLKMRGLFGPTNALQKKRFLIHMLYTYHGNDPWINFVMKNPTKMLLLEKFTFHFQGFFRNPGNM
jgi:hypothetical protein